MKTIIIIDYIQLPISGEKYIKLTGNSVSRKENFICITGKNRLFILF